MNGRMARIEALERVDDERQPEDDDRGTADGTDEASELRERAGAEAEGRPDEEQHDGRHVDRVHAPIVAQVGETWRRRALVRRCARSSADDDLGRDVPAATVGDDVRAGFQVAEVDAGSP